MLKVFSISALNTFGKNIIKKIITNTVLRILLPRLYIIYIIYIISCTSLHWPQHLFVPHLESYQLYEFQFF